MALPLGKGRHPHVFYRQAHAPLGLPYGWYSYVIVRCTMLLLVPRWGSSNTHWISLQKTNEIQRRDGWHPRQVKKTDACLNGVNPGNIHVLTSVI